MEIEKSTRIQEAHGLWELSVARVAALAECQTDTLTERATASHVTRLLVAASKDERAAFRNWQAVSKECGA